MTARTKTILVFAAIFLVGFTSGYLFNHTLRVWNNEQIEQREERVERWQQFRGADRSERSERMQQRARSRLARDLDLTESQQNDFFSKMGEYRADLQEEIRRMRTDEHEMVREHYETFRYEIGAILDSTQLEKLDVHLHPDSVRVRRHRSPRNGE